MISEFRSGYAWWTHWASPIISSRRSALTMLFAILKGGTWRDGCVGCQCGRRDGAVRNQASYQDKNGAFPKVFS